MALTKEIFDTLPDEVKADYEQDGDVFVTIDSKKVSSLKSSLNDLDAKTKREAAEREAETQRKIEEARNQAIEEAQKKGDWEERERLLREKFDDELKREREAAKGEAAKEYTLRQAQASLESDVKLLASELAVDESAKVALEMLIKQKAKLDESGNRNYFGDDGSALAITELSAFKDELRQSPLFARLVKGEPKATGGLADGANGGGSAPTGGDYVNMTLEQKVAYLEKNPPKRGA